MLQVEATLQHLKCLVLFINLWIIIDHFSYDRYSCSFSEEDLHSRSQEVLISTYHIPSSERENQLEHKGPQSEAYSEHFQISKMELFLKLTPWQKTPS